MLQVIAYTIDCKDPGAGRLKIAPQLSTGTVLGKYIDVEVIETERQGRLAACSQPLFTQVAGLKDWYACLLFLEGRLQKRFLMAFCWYCV